MSEQKEIALGDIINSVKRIFRYILSKWIIIALIAVVFAAVGVLYAWMQKPVYSAEITFTPESESGSGMGYSAIAAQFGLDIGTGSGNSFSGENLIHLITSKSLIEKTLYTPVAINNGHQLIINYYVKTFEIDKDWDKDDQLKNISFTVNQPANRVRDSIFKVILKDLSKAIDVAKVDKKADIISVKVSTTDELFSKLFVERLVENVIDYYTEYKVKKSRQNVDILQRQTDSVSRLISGNIQSIAVSNDLNVNPIRQTMRVGVQRRQVDAQVNGALYTELAKNLELAKLTLRKETPLVHIIDEPMLPLDKKKLGRAKAAIIFGFIGGFLAILYFLVRKILSGSNPAENKLITQPS